ncbi:uncharacterized protein B0I36DRAFT_124331 [Microdochium trichocladiopsis]|uniref:Uncharacterized protein n=1 Tax=Microdochium trichocladiopsis TaxID=1682393 RepID=A0A9P9BNT7_9PEZI|nr:uncharacterized protein B0I36DRAFT_124331 [Microdochium trichocladiopsis]KAH7031576.1 hypothetical protein B0I36DRAFT_124331 [Microdochium trichocladiopsis]
MNMSVYEKHPQAKACQGDSRFLYMARRVGTMFEEGETSKSFYDILLCTHTLQTPAIQLLALLLREICSPGAFPTLAEASPPPSSQCRRSSCPAALAREIRVNINDSKIKIATSNPGSMPRNHFTPRQCARQQLQTGCILVCCLPKEKDRARNASSMMPMGGASSSPIEIKCRNY